MDSNCTYRGRPIYCTFNVKPLTADLNPICHMLALLGAHYILHVSGLRVKQERDNNKLSFGRLTDPVASGQSDPTVGYLHEHRVCVHAISRIMLSGTFSFTTSSSNTQLWPVQHSVQPYNTIVHYCNKRKKKAHFIHRIQNVSGIILV